MLDAACLLQRKFHHLEGTVDVWQFELIWVRGIFHAGRMEAVASTISRCKRSASEGPRKLYLSALAEFATLGYGGDLSETTVAYIDMLQVRAPFRVERRARLPPCR